MSSVRVAVAATDQFSASTVATVLRDQLGFIVVTGTCDVAVLAVWLATETTVRALRARISVHAAAPAVVVTESIDDVGSLARAGVVDLVPREEVLRKSLAERVRAAAAGAEVPLAQRAARFPPARPPACFTDREVEVLRLLAAGLDSAAIAARLGFAERTVKNAIHAMTSRLRLRNRAHAVAVAARAGLI